MKKFAVQIFILIILIFTALYFGALGPAAKHFTLFKPRLTPVVSSVRTLTVDGTTIRIAIADTPILREKGLSGRQSIASDSGMLFTFSKADKYTFWMKGMLIPLDMIWLNNKTIIDVMKNIPPPTAGQTDAELPRFQPVSPADMVLEVNAGFADVHGIKVGDTVEIK